MRSGTSSKMALGDSAASASAAATDATPAARRDRNASMKLSLSRSALMDSWPCAVRTPSYTMSTDDGRFSWYSNWCAIVSLVT